MHRIIHLKCPLMTTAFCTCIAFCDSKAMLWDDPWLKKNFKYKPIYSDVWESTIGAGPTFTFGSLPVLNNHILSQPILRICSRLVCSAYGHLHCVAVAVCHLLYIRYVHIQTLRHAQNDCQTGRNLGLDLDLWKMIVYALEPTLYSYQKADRSLVAHGEDKKQQQRKCLEIAFERIDWSWVTDTWRNGILNFMSSWTQSATIYWYIN